MGPWVLKWNLRYDEVVNLEAKLGWEAEEAEERAARYVCHTVDAE
jgi:hypothetical protein